MKLCTPDKCTSCMACFNACPFDAITIVDSELSARMPVIDTLRCMECGLCTKVCPQINGCDLNLPKKVYALYTNNLSDRETCASGGVATAFSRNIIELGGCVYGVTVKNGLPCFIEVSNQVDLELLKGSKYVYCDTEKIYCKIQKALKNNVLCLFIGTPCQIAGLKSFLRKDFENLMTIDLICHGAPPFKYLHDHIASKIGSYKHVDNITFRGKDDFHIVVYDKCDNVLYRKFQYEDEYFHAFMKGLIFRTVCYGCSFAQQRRVSDITIGDFWGIATDALSGYNGKISVALLNTDRALKYFEMTKKIFQYEERDLSEAVNGNDQLRFPSPKSKQSIDFENIYIQNCDIESTFRQIGVAKFVSKNALKRKILYIPRLIKRIIINSL